MKGVGRAEMLRCAAAPQKRRSSEQCEEAGTSYYNAL
jgi:hypothetical protein